MKTYQFFVVLFLTLIISCNETSKEDMVSTTEKYLFHKEFCGDSTEYYKVKSENYACSNTQEKEIRNIIKILDSVEKGDREALNSLPNRLLYGSIPKRIKRQIFTVYLDLLDSIPSTDKKLALAELLQQYPDIVSLNQGKKSYNKEEYTQAKMYLTTADSLFRHSSVPQERVKSLFLLGEVERFRYNYKQSLNYHYQGLELAQRNNYKRYECKIHYALGYYYRVNREYEKSIESFKKSGMIAKLLQLPNDQTKALGGIAISLIGLERHSDALKYFHKSLHRAQQVNIPQQINLRLFNLGLFHSKYVDQDSAQYYLEKACHGYEISNCFNRNYLRAYRALADLYYRQGKKSKALQTYNKTLKHCENIDDKEIEAKIRAKRADLLLEMKDYETAAVEYKIHQDELEELRSKKSLTAVGQILAEQAHQKSQETIAELEEQSEDKEMMMAGLFVIIVLSILGIIYTLHRNRATKKRAKREVEEKIKQEKQGIHLDHSKKWRKNAPKETMAPFKKKIIREIETNKIYLDNSITMDTFSKMVGANPNAVKDALVEIYGMQFRQVINRFRVEESKRILTQDTKNPTISEVSRLSGFGTEASFHSNFKEIIGTTPKKFKDSIKKH